MRYIYINIKNKFEKKEAPANRDIGAEVFVNDKSFKVVNRLVCEKENITFIYLIPIV